MPTSKGIPGHPAGSSPFSPPSTASPYEEKLGLGPAGVGLRELGGAPGAAAAAATAAAHQQRRWQAWPGACWPGAPGGREGGGRGEEGGGEEQSAGPRRQDFLVWGLSTAQKEGDSETQPKGVEHPKGSLVPRRRRLGRPTRSDHRSGSTWRIRGLSRPLPRQPRDTWGFRGRAWAPPRRRGFLLFRSANFPRRCLAG